MERAYLPAVELVTGETAHASIIWLHGLGADGHDFEPIVPRLPAPPGIRFVFPHAPRRPVSINGGMLMPAWYDLREQDLRGTLSDRDGLARSVAAVADLVERETARGIPSRRILLAGFSQGGAVVLHAGLRLAVPLAGILGLSTYLVDGESLAREASPANRGLPVFLGHGTMDPMVAHAAGEATRDRLREAGYDVTWRSYPMGHEVCLPEIDDVGHWMGSVLGADLAQG